MLTTCASPANPIRTEVTSDLARAAGVLHPTISRIRKGHEQPHYSTLENVFDALDNQSAAKRAERKHPRLADLADAWTLDATNTLIPDWVRFRFLTDELRLHPALLAQAILPEPPQSASVVMDVLLAATAEKLADDAGISRPGWTKDRQMLSEPWFVETRPSKQTQAAAHSPTQFVSRGLHIPETAIWRERNMVLE